MSHYRYQVPRVILGTILSASTILPFSASTQATQTPDLTISQHQAEGIQLARRRKGEGNERIRRYRHGNRHNIANPRNKPNRWLRTMKRTRVAELFRTRPGLPGHVQAIQNEINRFNGYNPEKLNRWSRGVNVLKELKLSLISSAKGARFDFDRISFDFSNKKFGGAVSDLHLKRKNGILYVNGRPQHKR